MLIEMNGKADMIKKNAMISMITSGPMSGAASN